MNIFNEAIEAHVQWKMTLMRTVEAGVLHNMKQVADCRACDLGRWIYGEGYRYNGLPSFEAMCTSHEQFHRAAAEVAGYNNSGETAKARALLKPDSLFHQLSAKLVRAIMECSKELADSICRENPSTGKVRDILNAKNNTEILSIDGTASVWAAIKKMVDHNVGSLAVYNDEHLSGIFTERGYFKNLVAKGVTNLETPVSGMIDSETFYVDPEDSIEQCMILMTSTRTRHLPVMHEGKLAGVISIGDVIKRLVADDKHKLSQLEGYIHSRYGAA